MAGEESGSVTAARLVKRNAGLRRSWPHIGGYLLLFAAAGFYVLQRPDVGPLQGWSILLLPLLIFSGAQVLLLAFAVVSGEGAFAALAAVFQGIFWTVATLWSGVVMLMPLLFLVGVTFSSSPDRGNALQATLGVAAVCLLVFGLCLFFLREAVRLYRASQLREELLVLTRVGTPRKVECRISYPSDGEKLFRRPLWRWGVGQGLDRTVSDLGAVVSPPQLGGLRCRTYFFDGKLAAVGVASGLVNQVFLDEQWRDEDLLLIIRKDLVDSFPG